MAIGVFGACSLTGCAANKPRSLTPQTAIAPSQTAPQTPDHEALPAAIESPSITTLAGRLIDLDPAIRWACSYSGVAVEAVEKPSDSLRIYRMTDARHTPLRIELACDNFTRGHFEPREINASATFGRFPDTARQNRLLRKIQQRLDQLAKRKH